jgi:hypothetical protein
LSTTNCRVAYDCVNYQAAITKWSATCDEHTFNVYREGCGYDILQHTYGEGETLLAFYHPESGELKGWWQRSDTGEPECAGTVPTDCAGYSPGENQCEMEAGTPDLVEAGPVEAGTTGDPPDSALVEAGAMGTLPDGAPVECCPISDEPDCCMLYGGANIDGDRCGYTCDGMPWPDAGWTKGVDRFGCPIWIEPPATDSCCGCFAEEDGGTSSGTSSEAGVSQLDASRAPDASPTSDVSLDASL